MFRRSLITIALVLCAACTGPSAKNNGNNGNNGNNDTTNSATNNVTSNGSTNNVTSTNSATNGSTNSASNASTNNATLPSPCPDSAPDAGDPCDTVDLVCQFGDDPRMECRPRATCTATGWELADVDPDECDTLPTVECPATREDADGEACDPMDAYCTYEDGLDCHCTNCVDGPVINCQGEPVWMCDAPHADAECPPAMPNLGAGCANDGKRCEYHCGPGNARVCEGGVWTEADGVGCPISTRRAKKNIRYLTGDQVEAISERLMRMRLAHYEYIDPTIAPGEQLGFIIEDDPQSPAVDAGRDMVDLYGYASMLAADAQAKGERIDELEDRLESLERRLDELDAPACTPGADPAP